MPPKIETSEESFTNRSWNYLPLIVGGGIFLVALGVWNLVVRHDRSHLERDVSSAADRVAELMTRDIATYVPSLEWMAERWEQEGGVPRAEWEREAEFHLRDHPEYQGIGWVDSSFRVRWIVPLKENQEAENLDLTFEERRRKAVTHARDGDEFTIAQPVELKQGGLGLLLYQPINLNGEFGGLMAGVIRIQEWLDDLLETVAADYEFFLFDGETKIYQHPEGEALQRGEFFREEKFHFAGATLRISIWPSAEYLSRAGSSLPNLILLFGMPMAVLAGLTVYLAKESFMRARQEEFVSRRLQAEILEREMAELAKEELERSVGERTSELVRANSLLEQEMAERRLAEETARSHRDRLAHAARVSSLGEMTAGIAHQLNQPLSSIKNYADGAIERLRLGTETKEEFVDIFQRVSTLAGRSGEIIRHLRDLVQSRDSEATCVNIRNAVMQVVEIVESEAELKRVELCLELDPRELMVFVDGIQIEQVILNLIQNGFDAMEATEPASKKLTIRSCLDEAGRVEIAVTDAGPGLPDRGAERVFEPFFSTKSSGMGIGLSVCRAILEAYGGVLSASVEPEGGATFRFSLPVYPMEPVHGA